MAKKEKEVKKAPAVVPWEAPFPVGDTLVRVMPTQQLTVNAELFKVGFSYTVTADFAHAHSNVLVAGK